MEDAGKMKRGRGGTTRWALAVGRKVSISAGEKREERGSGRGRNVAVREERGSEREVGVGGTFDNGRKVILRVREMAGRGQLASSSCVLVVGGKWQWKGSGGW